MGLIQLRTLFDAYSARYTAEANPNGVATSIAIALINKVPLMRGIAPNEPSAAIWSDLMAVCGDQFSPNKKSIIENEKGIALIENLEYPEDFPGGKY